MAEPEIEGTDISLRAAEVASDVSETDKPQEQRLGRDLDRDGGQHRQRGGHARRPARRRGGAGRALDQRVGDLVG